MCYYVRYLSYVGHTIMQYFWLKVKWWLIGLSGKKKGKFPLIPFVWSTYGLRRQSLVLVLPVNILDENYAGPNSVIAAHAMFSHFIWR